MLCSGLLRFGFGSISGLYCFRVGSNTDHLNSDWVDIRSCQFLDHRVLWVHVQFGFAFLFLYLGTHDLWDVQCRVDNKLSLVIASFIGTSYDL